MSTNPRKRFADVRNGGELRFGELQGTDMNPPRLALYDPHSDNRRHYGPSPALPQKQPPRRFREERRALPRPIL